MRKKVDERIRNLIENGVKNRHRSMIVMIGDRYHDQIVNIHTILSKTVVKSRPNVLWCYDKKLELSSHKKKRAKQLKRLIQSGLHDREKVDPLSLFLETAGLTYCLYKDSERILGATFGMCILQDFEALTPDVLARSIETVEGGGVILLLLRSMASLTSFYTLVKDNMRFRTELHADAAPRFNERFLLSFGSCKACIVIDDELNVLQPFSEKPVPVLKDAEGLLEAEQKLKNMKEYVREDDFSPLIEKCRTHDQAKAVIMFLNSIYEKAPKRAVACLAVRGRGKSAALGLAIAGAVAAGYPNIYVTGPTLENLKTLFEFICKGLEALGYKEHLDFDVVRSSNTDSKKAIVRLNINKHHRQTIQYIQPQEHDKLSIVDLLVIDESAAFPLPIVKPLLGPYPIFISSTVNGYEGTGCSVFLKQLELQSHPSAQGVDGAQDERVFKKVELDEPIRYASGDPIESWLNGLLCLDVTNAIPSLQSGLPNLEECELYIINRDALFSYHKVCEIFLQRMMALYVSSNYKNYLNDLQLMADAPGHHLFVLLGPFRQKSCNVIPDILCVIQVCLEGQIASKSVCKSSSSSARCQSDGDQIPCEFTQQYQDTVFPTLSGVRIVRIVTHPEAKPGYDSQAVQILARYYEGQIPLISEETPTVRVVESKKALLLKETIEPRHDVPSLLVSLSERKPEKLHYMGVSFELTLELISFWRKHNFVPFFVGHAPSSVTGEHTCMVLKPLNSEDYGDSGSDKTGFLKPFFKDFSQRFVEFLGHNEGSTMDYELAMRVLDPRINFTDLETEDFKSDGFLTSIKCNISMYDVKRLESYTNNLVDYHKILDLIRKLARLYFDEKLPVTLSDEQVCVLLCVGLQSQTISQIEKQMGGRQQTLLHLIQVMRKLHKYLYGVFGKEFESSQLRLTVTAIEPNDVSMEEDLRKSARQVEEQMRPDTSGLDPELLQQYAIKSNIDDTLQNGNGNISAGSLISVKSSRKKRKSGDHKRDKSIGGGSSSSKRRLLKF